MRFVPTWRNGLALLAVLAVIAGVAAWWFGRPPAPPKDALTALRDKGVITIGVRAHAAPFSALDGANSFVGYEPDIGRALATALGVKPQFVSVDAQSAVKFLQRGRIDVAILPRDGLDRREPSIRSIEPGYYASGLNAVTLSTHPLGEWEELKDTSVCGMEGATPAQRMVNELGGRYVGFPDMTSALQALAAERCKAVVNDEVALSGTMKGDLDHQYSMTLETMDSVPWSVSLRASDKELGDRIAALIADWHKSGFFIERAKAWKLPDNPYLASMSSYYASR